MSEFDEIKIEEITQNPAIPSTSTDDLHVQVRFRPANSARHLPAPPDTQFSIPVRLGRLGLSELVNHILSLPTPRPFEFLIDNRFLRTTLEKYLEQKGLTAEHELTLEYLEATPPPERDRPTPHPDWVSSVDSCLGIVPCMLPEPSKGSSKKTPKASSYTKQDAILSVVGCYDHIVRVWAHSLDDSHISGGVIDPTSQPSNPWKKSEHTLVSQGAGHSGPVTSVRVVRPFQKSLAGHSSLILSGSHDKTIRLWSLNRPEPKQDSLTEPPLASKLQCLGVFDYHIGTVTAVESFYHPNRPGSLLHPQSMGSLESVKFLSAGFDGVVALWNNSPDYSIDREQVLADNELLQKGMGRKLKAQKTLALQSASKTDDLSSELELPHYRPVNVYLGHRGAVSSLIWPTANNFYTGGYDTTIRLWDLHEGINTQSWSGGHVVNCLDYNLGLNLIASGDQDGYVRLWDPRVDSSSRASEDGKVKTITTHKGVLKACDSWVSSVRWAPSIIGSNHSLLTTGYDGRVKLWDIRSGKPLHECDTSSERILGGDWVPATQPKQNGAFPVYSISGGTGKQVDRLRWYINISQ